MTEPKENPIKIRAVYNPGKNFTEIRVLITHPMDTGQVKDSMGHFIKKWYVTHVIVQQGNQTLLSMRLGTAISKNPYLFFKFKGGRKNDTITVTWLDNHDEKRTDSSKVL
jgi:sulfur-oxidizing protein SoxZ